VGFGRKPLLVSQGSVRVHHGDEAMDVMREGNCAECLLAALACENLVLNSKPGAKVGVVQVLVRQLRSLEVLEVNLRSLAWVGVLEGLKVFISLGHRLHLRLVSLDSDSLSDHTPCWGVLVIVPNWAQSSQGGVVLRANIRNVTCCIFEQWAGTD